MSREKVVKLLQRQKLVEGMVQTQASPRNNLVEGVVHRQHQAELQNVIQQLSNHEVVTMLASMPLEDGKLLWPQIDTERQNDLLWELSETLREQLVGHEEPGFSERQMNAFELVDGRLKQVSVRTRTDLVNMRPIWIDLVGVTPAERKFIGAHYGVDLPDPGDATGVSEFLCKRGGHQISEMRSPNSMVNRVRAAFQSRIGIVHF